MVLLIESHAEKFFEYLLERNRVHKNEAKISCDGSQQRLATKVDGVARFTHDFLFFS